MHERLSVRLGAPLEPHLRPVAQKGEIRPFFEELFTHHIPYWTEKTGYSYFTIPAEREFTITWSEQLFEQGFLRLDRLIMDGKTANLSMGIVMGDTFYWILTINNNAFNTYSPGMIGLAFRLEALAAQGIRQFNMGAGDFFYKIQSASYQEACKDSIVFNMRSFKGRLYRAWFLKRHPKAVQV
jgi:CelD/BcsL family acetyltransferase involved in cellulose biosynthesis